MKQLLRWLLLLAVGVCAGIYLLYGFQMHSRSELQPYHQVSLDAEADEESIANMSGLNDYIARENTLFHQLKGVVTNIEPTTTHNPLNRFHSGNWSDPTSHATNWNRTFELTADNPRAAVLLLHGLSDSPYSMRALAHALHDRGAWVVGLRLPGHGTAPAALRRINWQDFTAAVRLAARHLAVQSGPGVPFYIVGYSNGAALSLEYTLSCLTGEDLPRPEGLVLISPAIAVSPLAMLARPSIWLSHLPGLEKMAWLSIEPEFDPYKYSSFAVNGGDQIYRLTRSIANQINQLDTGEGVAGFPRVLAFQSVVDATIPAARLVDDFMSRLAPEGHHLVLFDINRFVADMDLFKTDPRTEIENLLATPQPFSLSLLTNRKNSRDTLLLKQKSGTTERQYQPLPLRWPQGIYSLSHVALPFSPDDPVYGAAKAAKNAPFTLGSLELRGEKNVLLTSTADLMRLRYNPFYTVLEEHVIEWCKMRTGDRPAASEPGRRYHDAP